MMKDIQARQGDIYIRSVKKLPEGLKPRNSAVLAYGEDTGHAHRITSPPMDQLEMMSDEKGDIYIMSKTEEIVAGHDEHDEITLPAGQWFCISRQREYDPLLESQRVVAD